MKNKSYVYVYLDPRKSGKFIYEEYEFDHEPFYIGKGSGKRCYNHITRMLEKRYNPIKGNKISRIQKECLKDPIIIKFKDGLSHKDAYLLEEDMIKTIGRIDKNTGPLTNLTDGGDGVSNVSDKTKQKLREWVRTDGYKEKIRQSMLGKKLPKETVDKIKETKIKNGTWDSPVGNEYSAKDFVIVTPTNDVLYINNLKKFCKNHYLKYNMMRRVVDGYRNHHKGYKVSSIITDEEIEKMKNIKILRNTTGYYLISPDGKKYKCYNLKEFCKEHNLSRTNICKAYRNNKKYKGWKCFPIFDNKEDVLSDEGENIDVYER